MTASHPRRDAPGTSATPIDRARRPLRPLNVTIIAANTFEHDSRFLRTAESLAEDGHEVTVLGWAGPGLAFEERFHARARLVRLEVSRPISEVLSPLPAAVRFVVCRLLGLDAHATVLPADAPVGLDRLRQPARRLLEVASITRRLAGWTDLVVGATPDTHVFHCQSLVALPVARAAARRCGARFVYDVADYHPEAERLARMPGLVRRAVAWQERRWARDAVGLLAVSDPVADLVTRRWDVTRPLVLLNCPPAWKPGVAGAPRSIRLRDAAGISHGRPIVLFQGGFSIDRGLEELVDAADDPCLRGLEAAVVFMGYGRLRAFLEGAARTRPGRIYVLPAVAPAELLEWTSGADVSFIGQPPRTLNHRMNLPNKLFESLMAGVPVVVAEGNEQCRLVTLEGVGRCVAMDRAATIAEALADVIAQPHSARRRLREHCRDVALRRYTWEQNAGGLVGLYRALAESGQPPGGDRRHIMQPAADPVINAAGSPR